jgi:PKD repeat protein
LPEKETNMRQTSGLLRRARLVGTLIALSVLAGCVSKPGAIDFTSDPSSGPAPLAVAFHATVSDAAQAFAWDFGDGELSAETDPVHVYAQAGTYSVSLTVTTAAGPRTERKANLIHVTAASGPDLLFWIERGSGTIRRAPLDGGAPSAVLSGLIGPEDLAVAGGRIYWTDPGAGTVESAALDGSYRQVIAAGQNYPTGIAVDAARARVYWSTLPSAADVSPGVAGAIKRAHLDGTSVEILASYASDTSFAWQIALDPGAGRLYWLANDWVGIGASARVATCTGMILRANLDARSSVALADGLCGGTDLGLDGAYLYWTDEDAGTISRMNVDGTGVTILVAGQAGAESVAVSSAAGKIYWTAGNSLLRAELDGSGIETLYTGLNLPEGVTVGR